MFLKPFRPPLLKKPSSITAEKNQSTNEPSAKRRCISPDDDDDGGGRDSTRTATSKFAAIRPVNSLGNPRKPLIVVRNPPSPPEDKAPSGLNGAEGYYNVLWRKPTAKKQKTWDGDGILVVRDGYASLKDIAGRDMGRIQFNESLEAGSTLSIAGKDIEVDSTMLKEDYLAGRSFLKSGSSVTAKPHAKPTTAPFKTSFNKSQNTASSSSAKITVHDGNKETQRVLNVAAPQSTAMKTAFKNPLKESTVMPQRNGPEPVPRHDPNAPGALVMKRPSKPPRHRQTVDVVVDPLLGKHLREHQREGVKFLYECVMCLRDFNGQGAILADEMGLGKTLQTIALLWTLLKQNAIWEAPPVVKKALIVCPVTLIKNWQKEFRKWLGSERLGVFVFDGKKTRLTDFTMGRSYSVMIIGYERLRTVQEELTKGSGIDIVIADEGHRLKTAQNKSAQAIQSLNTSRRVILSGTPIQNDMSEFFAMVNFVNEGCLGTLKQFTKNFEGPIVKSRQPNATASEIELGEARSEELARETSQFILRRTAEILSEYLPPKSEYVILCNPTPTQSNIYRHVLASPIFQSVIGNSESALQLITVLKKLCNSPSLLNPKVSSDEPVNGTVGALLESFPAGLLKTCSNHASGKIRVLDQLLHNLRTSTSEKVVLVSNYTSTLDLLATLLTSLALPFLRLDGTTPASKRQGLVDDFNRSSASGCFAFLLSAKAGGTGLNLIGASRLVLFDIDWNPANDLQAMARIHRDGQKRHCRIYRFLIKGGLEERIWQRQITKTGLANSVMEKKGGTAQFSREELKDLFKLDERPGCQTHELLDCSCSGTGMPSAKDGPLSKKEIEDDDDEWLDIDSFDTNEVTTVINDSEDDEPLPDIPQLVKASQLDMEEQERSIRAGRYPRQNRAKRAESEMQPLMHYYHLDTSAQRLAADGDGYEDDRMEELIDDDILMDVLRDEDSGVGFVFRKTASSAMKLADQAEGKSGFFK